MFEQLEDRLSKAGANVLRYVMYKDGELFSHERIASYPCSNCYSISKNFTATAIGLAYDRGLLNMDDPILKYFEKELPAKFDKNLPNVKIRDLLTQTMGLSVGSLFEADRYQHHTDDFIQVALSADLPFPPGDKFVYSNSTYYLLSCIVEKVSGMPMDMFLQKTLFRQLGITDYAWERCPKGHTMGATGLYLSTADMLKLGILYMNSGMWENERVLSEQWVRMATTKIAEPIPTAFSFWIRDNGYVGLGAYGQCLIVWPDKKIVLAAHAFDGKSDIEAMLWDYLMNADGLF